MSALRVALFALPAAVLTLHFAGMNADAQMRSHGAGADTLRFARGDLSCAAGERCPADEGDVTVPAFNGEPGGYVVVAVPVPGGDAELSYDARPEAGLRLLGKTAGRVLSGNSDALLLTLALPRDARAGLRSAATVTFSDGARLVARTRVQVDVAVVRGATISQLRTRLAATPGDRVPVTFVLTNNGNSVDTLIAMVEVPAGWRVSGAERPLVLQPGEQRQVRIVLTVPALAVGTMSAIISVVSASSDVARARGAVAIEVLRSRADRTGMLLTTGAASVLSGGHGSSSGSVELRGRVTQSVSVHGRALLPLNSHPADLHILSKLGYGGAPFVLALNAPHWRMEGGVVRADMSSSAGNQMVGTGALFAVHDSTLTVRAFLASPYRPGIQSMRGELLSAQFAANVAGVTVTSTASHLEEEGVVNRRLDAIGLGASLPAHHGITLSGDVAYRSHMHGSGIGWSTTVSRKTEVDQVGIRVSYQPGGSLAYARAAQELSFNGHRQLTARIGVSANAWQTHDEGSTFAELRSDGWSVGPRIRIGTRSSLGFEAASRSAAASGGTGSFGSSEQQLAVTASTGWSFLHTMARVQYGTSERTTTTASGAEFTVETPRLLASGSVGLASSYGSVDVDLLVEQTSPASSFLPRRNMLSVRASSPELRAGSAGLVLHGVAQRQAWFGDRDDLLVLQSTADLLLPAGLKVSVSAERNPLFSLNSSDSWTTAIRVTKSTLVPRLDRQPHGVVFHDLNGNGRRDSGERGIGGVIITGRGATVATDQRGRFELPSHGRPPRVDPRSIPPGWMLGDGPFADDRGRIAIGVIQPSTVEVWLSPVAPDTMALPRRLENVILTVTDQLGREWLVPSTRVGTAVFDALPPGTYIVQADARRLNGLVMMGHSQDTVVITSGGQYHVVEFAIGPRPVRILSVPASPAAPAAGTTPDVRWNRPSLAAGGGLEGLARFPLNPVEAYLLERAEKRPFVIRRGDTLRLLSELFLGDEMLWRMIYHLNLDSIEHPDLIYTDNPLVIPVLDSESMRKGPPAVPRP